MDNIESLMGNMSVKKSKKQKDYTNSQSKHSLGGSNPFGEAKELEFMSPKSPVFRPQLSPSDMLPEILLPTSEMDSEENETSDPEIGEVEYYVKRKQHFSCPNGPTLNIWVGNARDECGFEMIEENDADLFNLEEPEHPVKKHTAPSVVIEEGNSPAKKNIANGDFKRFRSQSENITACTIFKFMEANRLSQKRLLLE